MPENLKNPINFKIVALIIAGIIGFHILINFLEDSDWIVYAFSIGIPGAVSAFSFLTAKRYSGANVFSKAYVALGIGFIGIFLGEVTYLVYEQFLDLEPYPSIADVFFFLFYPMIMIYLILNIKFFSPITHIAKKISIGIIPVITTAIYFTLTLSNELNFDFYYGIIFISGSSMALGISVYAASIFKGGLLGTSWLILVIGILIIVGGDTWYYYIELFDGYALAHPVNLFWYGGYILILYSLYKHKTSI